MTKSYKCKFCGCSMKVVKLRPNPSYIIPQFFLEGKHLPMCPMSDHNQRHGYDTRKDLEQGMNYKVKDEQNNFNEEIDQLKIKGYIQAFNALKNLYNTVAKKYKKLEEQNIKLKQALLRLSNLSSTPKLMKEGNNAKINNL